MAQGMQQGMVANAAVQMFMRTLQATTAELAELTSQALSSNPALEELPPPEQDLSSQPLNHEGTLRHQRFMENLTNQPTLAEHLEEQIRSSALPYGIESAALSIIPYLNHHGFFAEEPARVAKELGLTDSAFRKALLAVQDLEPAGVGAVDLRESLMLQLRRKGEAAGLPMKLLQNHWDDLVQHRYAEAASALDVEEEAIILAARHIARLNPDPGSGFSRAELGVITPDVEVLQDGGEYYVELTGEDVPRLGISAEYREMMAERMENAELRSYLSRCFREGREFIRAIAERQQTILLVAQSIVKRQKEFLRHGPTALAPLRMESIADDAGISVSTVSRAVRGKYLKCAHGVYELRSFFSAALESDSAAGASAGGVQARIRSLIANENPAHPLSDAAIEETLAAEGITVARRTIAKYRENLHILPARLRKQK